MKINIHYWEVTSVVSDSVRPHGLQPTRLLRPWDSPGKNTGVGCHFLLQCKKVESESEVTQSCLTLSDPMDCSPPGSSIHGIFWATVLEWGAIAFSQLNHNALYNQWWIPLLIQSIYIESRIVIEPYWKDEKRRNLCCGVGWNRTKRTKFSIPY